MNDNFFQSMQKLTEQTKQMQEKLAAIRVEGKTGGDLVVLTMNGHFLVESVNIDESLLTPEHKTVLEGMLIAASTDAVTKVREAIQASMGDQWSSLLNLG